MQRLRLSARMATRNRDLRVVTWVRMVEDLAALGVGPACIVEVGYPGYVMLPVRVDVPAVDIELHADLAGTELRTTYQNAIGFDPVLLGGRLTLTVEGDFA